MHEFDENEVHFEVFLHILWSTKNQENLIPDHIANSLYHYMCDVTLAQACNVIGGKVFSDHVQLIIKFSPDAILDDLILALKVGAKLWLRTNFVEMKEFDWQKSDFSFSLSSSSVEACITQIHQSKPFLNIIQNILDENGCKYEFSEVLV